MDEIATTARILSEALPFLQRYDDQIIVVKYGGHAMGDPELAKDFAEDVVLLRAVGINPVVVHGGGPQIDAMLKKLGVTSQRIDGLRVTDRETANVAEMVEKAWARLEAQRAAERIGDHRNPGHAGRAERPGTGQHRGAEQRRGGDDDGPDHGWAPRVA